jgi:hypothetical protein
MGVLMNGYDMGMYGWNTSWMWVIGLLVIVGLILLLRARR